MPEPAANPPTYTIDPSLRAVLRSSYTIRKFFILFGGLLGALMMALWLATLLGSDHQTLRDVSTNFLGSFAANVAMFIAIYGFYVYVTPPGLRDAEVVPLRDVEIGDEIIRTGKDISDYWFWGRTGTYFRSAVLPDLDKTASLQRKHIKIRLVLPDPNQEGSGDRYRRLKKGLGEEADGNKLAANVAATVVAIVQACRANPYLKAEIGLSRSLPVLRYDLFTAGGLVARDARTLLAILVNAGNPYFDMFQDAVENELSQSRKLTWDEDASGGSDADPFCAESLSRIRGLPPLSEEVVTAARAAISQTSRYAR